MVRRFNIKYALRQSLWFGIGIALLADLAASIFVGESMLPLEKAELLLSAFLGGGILSYIRMCIKFNILCERYGEIEKTFGDTPFYIDRADIVFPGGKKRPSNGFVYCLEDGRMIFVGRATKPYKYFEVNKKDIEDFSVSERGTVTIVDTSGRFISFVTSNADRFAGTLVVKGWIKRNETVNA